MAVAQRPASWRTRRPRLHARAAVADRTARLGGLPALDASSRPDGVEPVSRRDPDLDRTAHAVDYAGRHAAAGRADRGFDMVAQSTSAGLAAHRLVLRRA